MARTLRSSYSQIRKPSLSSLSGASSGSISSIAKKTLSAEDAIYDSQYESGQMSAEVYMQKLQERSSRSWNTPLQLVRLQEKMGSVGQEIQDAQVDRDYQSGDLSTNQVLQYEKYKLEQMSATDSEAYIKQQQKVASLQDKVDRETRSDWRSEQLLRISQMPEDTSERAFQKAQMYEELANNARLDGDTSSANSLQAQANNAYQSAQRASINDYIRDTRLSVSQTQTEGIVPSAESGAKIFSSFGGGGVSVSDPTVSNALKSLDRKSQTLGRLYQQRSDTEMMIATYREAVDAASGDQKTTLETQLNNLVQSLVNLDANIANTTDGINESILNIQEKQAGAAAGSFNQEVRTFENEFKKAERDLEIEFAKGNISKEEYLLKGSSLATDKLTFLEQASEGFNQYGNDYKADTYMQKAGELNLIAENLQQAAENPDWYEPVAVEPGGKLTNLLGSGLKPGDVALVDVRRLKDGGVFESNYINVDGVYHRVNYANQELDSDGFPLSPGLSEDLARIDNNFWYYDKNGKKVSVKAAEVLDEQNGQMKAQFIPESELLKRIESNEFVQDGNKFTQVQPEEPGFLQRIFGERQPNQSRQNPNPAQNSVEQFVRDAASGKGIDALRNLMIPSPLQTIQRGKAQGPQSREPGFFGQAINAGKNFLSDASNSIGSTISKFLGNIVPQAYASELEQPSPSQGISPSEAIDRAAEIYAPGDDEFKKVLHAIALAESSGDPNAIGDRGQSVGLFQNRMVKGRGGNYSKQQLLDPEFNSKLAAEELSRYYKMGVQKGLTGDRLVAYVSKYGQRPAAGLEENAAEKYGQMVGATTGPVKTNEQMVGSKLATATPGADKNFQQIVRATPSPTPQMTPNPNVQQVAPRVSNIPADSKIRSNSSNSSQLVSGLQPGKYDFGQPLMTPAPTPRQSFSVPKIELPKISAPKISIPEPIKNVSQGVSNIVQNVGSSISNALKKLKFW